MLPQVNPGAGALENSTDMYNGKLNISRMLATLYKDERCQQLSCFNILEKMYLDRLIKRTELTEFETLLQVTIEYYSGLFYSFR